MKKYLSIILICLIVLTGCGKKETSVEVLKKVLTNEKEANSIAVKASVDFEMEQDGMNIDLPLELIMKVDAKNEKNGNIYINLADNPFTGTMELYANIKDKEMTMYMPSSIIDLIAGLEDTNNHWIILEETISEGNESNTNFDFEEYKQEINKIIELITEDDFIYIDEIDGLKHYQLKITTDLIKRIFEKIEEEYDSSIEEVLTEALVLDFYIKDYMITKVEFDMTKMLATIADSMEDELFDISMIKKLLFLIEVSGYNETTVTIPENVKNTAITSEEYLKLYIGEE